MIHMPKASRMQLKFSHFDQVESGDWMFTLPEYYSELFNNQEKQIMEKSNTDWRTGKGKKSKYAFFKGLSSRDLNRVEKFCQDYKKHVILGLNKHIKSHFSYELDFCLAVEYNFVSPEDHTRTKIGDLVYKAKYGGEESAIPLIVELMSLAFNRLPKIDYYGMSYLSFIPRNEGFSSDLGMKVAKGLAAQSNIRRYLRDGEGIIYPKLLKKKPAFKDKNISQKIEIWKNFYKKGLIKIDCPVKNTVVYIIDDLYQSGTTMWSYARFLKEMGANYVMGLVCEKAWRDSHN